MRARLSLGLAVLGLAVATIAPAVAGGGGGTRADFYISRETDHTLPLLSVRFDRVIYMLSIAGGKYRVFPVQIENPAGGRHLVLSREQDSFTVVADGHQVRGILDLAAADPAMWDGLDTNLRQALLYPASIEANQALTIYVLAPAAEVPGLPTSFTYAIQSLGRPLELVRPPPMAE